MPAMTRLIDRGRDAGSPNSAIPTEAVPTGRSRITQPSSPMLDRKAKAVPTEGQRRVKPAVT